MEVGPALPRFTGMLRGSARIAATAAGSLAATIVVVLALVAQAHAGTWHGGPISIADGLGAPYPSTIAVVGEKPIVSDVNVGLRDLTHSSTSDIDVLLVGPRGQGALFLSDTGSGGVTSATVNFDDQAPSKVFGPLTGGTHQPTDVNDGSADDFSALAPPGPFGTDLGVFDGIDPNGAWRLYVVDDKAGDTGSIGSWRLAIAGRTPARATVRLEAGPRVGEDAGRVRVTIIRTPPARPPLLRAARLTYAAGPFLRTRPSADFAPVSGTVDFAAGHFSKTITIPVVNDHVPEPSEWFMVRFGSSGDINASNRRIEISDDDPRAAAPSLRGPRAQRVLRQGNVVVRARPNAFGAVRASGSVALGNAARSIRLKPLTRKVSRKREVTLRLGLTRKAERALRRALRGHRRLHAKVKVTLKDLAGGKATATRRITLKR
jgi:subtilisin-like proprotein convertase family protein